MPALTVCPECRTRLRFGADTRGQLIHCPECQAGLQVTTDGRVERAPASSHAASAADGIGSSTALRRLAIAGGLILVAFGIGWSLGTANQPEPDKDAAASKPSPIKAAQALPQPDKQEAAAQQPQAKSDRAASDVQLASATEQQPQAQSKLEQSNAKQPTVEPIAVVNAPAEPQQPELRPQQAPADPETERPQARKPVPPPPVPREEVLPAPLVKPVVPIEKLAQQKLQRFEVSKPTPLKEVLRDLSELLAGRVEVAENIPTQDLDQRVTVNVADSTTLGALEAALKSTSLRATIRGDRIVISRE